MTHSVFAIESKTFQRATFASFLVFFAALPAISKTSTAKNAVMKPSATLVSSRGAGASSVVSSLSLRDSKTTALAVSSRKTAVPQRLSAPDLALRAETPHLKNISKAKATSSTRWALATPLEPKTAVRSVSASAVSDDLVQNYLMLTKPTQNIAANNVASSKARAATNEKPAMTGVTTPKTAISKAPGEVKSAPLKSSTRLAMNAPLPTSTPAVGATTTPIVITRRDPANLSSRHKDRLLLAQLEADLMRADRGLDRANVTLTRGQKQLMSVGTTLRTAMLDAGNDAKGLNPFVRVAMRYAGTPYVWGGESRNGFDCSGFIIVVMRDLGYRALPHSAAEQFNYGTPIARELLKPGDIVFFKNTYKQGVSHVGIYLGQQRFINAAGTGKGTIVSRLDDPHWIAHYAGARRLIRG